MEITLNWLGLKQVLAFILRVLQSLWPRAYYLSSGAFSRTVLRTALAKQSVGADGLLGNKTWTRAVERLGSSIVRSFRHGYGNAGSPTGQ